LALIVFFILLYIIKVVNPIILSVGEAKIKSLATRSINAAVNEVITSGYSYGSLISIIFDNNGDVALIEANAMEINRLAKEIASVSQTRLDLIGEQGVGVPLGSLTGIPIFMGQGPDIRFKLYPIGSITCSFSSQFIGAGVNQTNHKIYVNISSTINVVLPIDNKQISTKTQILIAESIIVGKVPDVYLNSSLENMLPLIP
jgi:sporulation protein YunB